MRFVASLLVVSLASAPSACPAAPVEPLISSNPAASAREEAALGGYERLQPQQSSSPEPSAAALIEAGRPQLLRGTAVDSWPARQWTWESLAPLLGDEPFADVMQTDGNTYVPPDANAALEPLLRANASGQASWRNMSAREFFAAVEAARSLHDERASASADEREARGWRSTGQRLVHSGEVPERLRAALEPQGWLYPHADDAEKRMQSMWLSTPGVRTHTHFDNDRNLFVQLVGTKRFVLWEPRQTAHLCPFPRLHPLWHKSRVDFEAPDLSIAPCARYNESRALVAEVGPGDVLYVPPFWWHTVETLGPTPSLSLSTLSRWPQLYIHLNAIYTHEFFFDKLRSYGSRLYGLRAFLTQLLRKAAGGAAGSERGLIRSLRRQYAGLEHLFERSDDDAALCVLDARGTPTCRNCLANTNFDVTIVWDEHLLRLPEDVRAVVLPEFVEELTQYTVGTAKTLPFWERCFDEQPFFLTRGGTPEHATLWLEGAEEEAEEGAEQVAGERDAAPAEA